MVETIITARSEPVLSDEILARCTERAPIDDRENCFFSDERPRWG